MLCGAIVCNHDQKLVAPYIPTHCTLVKRTYLFCENMADLLVSFEQDSMHWGSALRSTFTAWPSQGPALSGKRRAATVEESLCGSMARLSVTRERLMRPHRSQPSTTPGYTSTDRGPRHDDMYSVSLHFNNLRSPPLRISSPMPSNDRTGRSHFLAARPNPRDPAPPLPVPTYTQRIPHRRARVRPRSRRRRNRVYAPRPVSAEVNADMPPPYSAYDPLVPRPSIPFSDPRNREYWRLGRRRGVRRSLEVRVGEEERPNATTNRVKRSIGGAKSKVKNLSGAVLRMQKGWQIKRAKSKLKWLQNKGYLSDQERMLARELAG